MVGRYPNDELWRISVAIALIAFFIGLVAGFIWRRRIVTGRAEPGRPVPWWRTTLATIGRLWPLIFGVALLLSLTSSVGPWLTVLAAIVGGVVGRLLGPLLPARPGRSSCSRRSPGSSALILLPPRARRRDVTSSGAA